MYLEGIGGVCFGMEEFTPYNDVSSEVVQAIKNRCNVCPCVDIQFDSLRYSINERHSPLRVQLVLSNSLSTDITVQVESIGITATGKLWAIIH